MPEHASLDHWDGSWVELEIVLRALKTGWVGSRTFEMERSCWTPAFRSRGKCGPSDGLR